MRPQDIYQPPYSLPPEEFDPNKTSRQLALEIIEALPDDAPWREVAEALVKARLYVFDHGSMLEVLSRPFNPDDCTIIVPVARPPEREE